VVAVAMFVWMSVESPRRIIAGIVGLLIGALLASKIGEKEIYVRLLAGLLLTLMVIGFYIEFEVGFGVLTGHGVPFAFGPRSREQLK